MEDALDMIDQVILNLQKKENKKSDDIYTNSGLKNSKVKDTPCIMNHNSSSLINHIGRKKYEKLNANNAIHKKCISDAKRELVENSEKNMSIVHMEKNSIKKKNRNHFAKPTLSSTYRNTLRSEKFCKKKESNIIQYIPSTSAGPSYQIGMVIQENMCRTKLDPKEKISNTNNMNENKVGVTIEEVNVALVNAKEKLGR